MLDELVLLLGRDDRIGAVESARSGTGALQRPDQKLNIAFLVALAFAVAASANLPALLLNLFWRRFDTRGAT